MAKNIYWSKYYNSFLMTRSIQFWHSTLRIAVNWHLEMTQKVILKQLFCHRLSSHLSTLHIASIHTSYHICPHFISHLSTLHITSVHTSYHICPHFISHLSTLHIASIHTSYRIYPHFHKNNFEKIKKLKIFFWKKNDKNFFKKN